MSNPDTPASLRRRALVPKEQCPLVLAAELVADRWTMLILREAFYGVSRYDDMLADLKAPRSMLTDRLGKMVERGLLTRKAYKEPGDRERNAYVLTSMGQDLATSLVALTQWGEAHLLEGPAPVGVVHRATGIPISAALVDRSGNKIPTQEAELRLTTV